MSFPLNAQQELDRLYESVGAVTTKQKINLHFLLDGESFCSGSDEAHLGAIETIYLADRGFIKLQEI